MASLSGQRGKDVTDDCDDEYWNKPRQRRNFFDENAADDSNSIFGGGRKEAHSFKQSLKEAGLDFDLEEQDTISMEGGGVTRFSTGKPSSGSFSGVPSSRPNSLQSARGTASTPPSNSSVPITTKQSRAVSIPTFEVGGDTTSNSLEVSTSDPLFVHKRSTSVSLGEKKDTSQSSSPMSSHSSTQGSVTSIEDAIRRDSRPSMTEVVKLQAEINALNRKIKNLEKSRWSALPVADTVSRIITGERYSLEPYKSLKDKMSLLDAAVGFHDGNAILAIVIFLKKTLSISLFHKEIGKRPEAVNQYIAFLKSYHSKEDSVASELGALGRVEEAALWRYKLANNTNIPQTRLKNLMDCNSMWFQRSENLSTEHVLISEQVLLLNRHLYIEPRDQRFQQEGRPPFREMPRKTSLYFQPLITTLFYCCLYHYNIQESDPSSPACLKKDFQLSDKQYLFQALLARARLKQWSQVEALLTSKNWLGKARMKAAVNFEQVVYILQTVRAPYEIIGKYMMLIENQESRIAMAAKFNNHVVVIDTLAQMKDRQRLVAYRSKVINTPADNHWDIVLRNPANKWKN